MNETSGNRTAGGRLAEPLVLYLKPDPVEHARAVMDLALQQARGLLTWAGIPLLIVMFVLVYANTKQGGIEPFPWGRFIGLWLGTTALFMSIILGAMLLDPVMARIRARDKRMLIQELTITLGEDFVIIKDSSTELKRDWSFYLTAFEGRNEYLLTVRGKKQSTQFIPKGAFNSPAQESAFRDLLARKLKFKG